MDKFKIKHVNYYPALLFVVNTKISFRDMNININFSLKLHLDKRQKDNHGHCSLDNKRCIVVTYIKVAIVY